MRKDLRPGGPPIRRLAALGLVSAMLCGCAVSHRSTAAAAPAAPPTSPRTIPESEPIAPSAPATTDTGTNARRYLGAQTGYATFLASSFHGNESASGEVFDAGKLVAAHRTLPFGSIVRVTNLENGRSVTVRIIDRGPYGKNYREGTIIDLSRAAARRVRMMQEGQVRVRLLVLRLGAES